MRRALREAGRSVVEADEDFKESYFQQASQDFSSPQFYHPLLRLFGRQVWSPGIVRKFRKVSGLFAEWSIDSFRQQ